MSGTDGHPTRLPGEGGQLGRSPEGRELSASIDRLEALLRRSASIPDALTPGEKGDALRLRKAIAEVNARIFELIERAAPRGEAWEPVRHDARALRAAIAAHLSAWPVSSIEAAHPGYDGSLRNLRAAYGSFIGTARGALDC